jgi:Domain of unknown function (DUF4157)
MFSPLIAKTKDSASQVSASITLNKSRKSGLTGQEPAPVQSWDFGKISLFPRDQKRARDLRGAFPHQDNSRLGIWPSQHWSRISIARPAHLGSPSLPASSLSTSEASGQSTSSVLLINTALATAGHSLPAGTLAFFESRFGFDFSRVRIHTDEAAARSARLVRARAYTIGQHIIFGAGRYHPESFGGRALLAHELAHTIQQRNMAGGELHALDRLRRANSKEESEAEQAADEITSAQHSPALMPGADLAIACAPDNAHAADPAAGKLHDWEQFGDAWRVFEKNNASLGDAVLSKIRSGIIKLANESGTYEVAYSFFDYYSGRLNGIRQMTADEEKKAKASDRKAETLGGTTTLRSDVLSYSDKQLAVLLLHEFSHTGQVPGDIAGGGSYQEGQSYGVEYFYAEIAHDTARMIQIQGIVSDAEVLGYSKAANKPRFQDDFKVTYALLTALREVVTHGSSPRLPFPDLTSAGAQLLEEQVVTRFQNPSGELAKYIEYVRAHLASFRIPPV